MRSERTFTFIATRPHHIWKDAVGPSWQREGAHTPEGPLPWRMAFLYSAAFGWACISSVHLFQGMTQSSSFRQRVFWMRDNNNQIFWRYSPGELIALWVPHLKYEKCCFKKRYEQAPCSCTTEQGWYMIWCGSRLWFVWFSLLSKEKRVGLHILPRGEQESVTGRLHVACC